MKLVLIGIQGAGKSTQGVMLSEKYNIPYLSSGHIFRGMAKEKSQTGRFLKELMNAGALIPDDMTLKVITEYLQKPEYENGYILDGFPRTVPQAEAFANGVDKVIFLDVSRGEALWRISGRETSDREDDTLQALRIRIESFFEHTMPVVDHYDEKGKLIKVDGELEIEGVFDQITSSLDACFNKDGSCCGGNCCGEK